jgi:hypothetical protein
MARIGTDHVPKRDITGVNSATYYRASAPASSDFHRVNNAKKRSNAKPLKSRSLTLAVTGVIGIFEGADLTSFLVGQGGRGAAAGA